MIEFVNDDSCDIHHDTREEYLLSEDLVSCFPYISDIKALYNRVLIPVRKVSKHDFQQLVDILVDKDNDRNFAFSDYKHYERLKFTAEFLLAETAVNRLKDILCRQINSYDTKQLAQFQQIDTNDTIQQENIKRLEELIQLYLLGNERN